MSFSYVNPLPEVEEEPKPKQETQVQLAFAPIKIDGRFEDWGSVPN